MERRYWIRDPGLPRATRDGGHSRRAIQVPWRRKPPPKRQLCGRSYACFVTKNHEDRVQRPRPTWKQATPAGDRDGNGTSQARHGLFSVITGLGVIGRAYFCFSTSIHRRRIQDLPPRGCNPPSQLPASGFPTARRAGPECSNFRRGLISLE